MQYLYADDAPIKAKLETVCKEIYLAGGEPWLPSGRMRAAMALCRQESSGPVRDRSGSPAWVALRAALR